MPLPTIPSGNVFSSLPTGFNVDNSCRFNDGDSAKLHKTPSSNGDQQKYTFSCWFKRSNIVVNSDIFAAYYSGAWRYTHIGFNGSNQLVLEGGVYSTSATSNSVNLITNRVFRDPSAWYSIVVAVDTTQGTAANRVKIYINGTQETSFATETYPSQNDSHFYNVTTTAMEVGALYSSQYFDGYMAEVYWIDGTQYAASDFGEFDEDSPTIWKPKDASGLTFGTNGFYLDFKDSANLGNDANGGTDLTEVNLAAADQYIDSPTRNYAVLNPLVNFNSATFSEGNTFATKSGAFAPLISTIAVNSGKFYMEMKLEGANPRAMGLVREDWNDFDDYLGSDDYSWGTYWESDGTVYHDHAGSNVSTSTVSNSSGDVIQLAFDGATGKYWIGHNNTWLNSGDPAAGSNPIFTLSATDLTYDIFFGYSARDGLLSANFGNGVFKAATISSAGTTTAGDDSIWEYDCPSGFYGLSAKNLNQ